MILLRKCLPAFFGLCTDGIIAAGVYVPLAVIGVFVRPMGKTDTRKYISLYETVIILGGILGDVLDVYGLPIYVGPYLGTPSICAYGLSVGISMGYPVMPLAGTPKALPVISRRIHLAVGLRYLILAPAAGKITGSLVHLWNYIVSLG